jgi:outer membrane protein assembly factor BamB
MILITVGILKWRYMAGGSISYASPAIGSDGTIYIGCYDNYFYAINSTGNVIFT